MSIRTPRETWSLENLKAVRHCQVIHVNVAGEALVGRWKRRIHRLAGEIDVDGLGPVVVFPLALYLYYLLLNLHL